MRVGKCFRRRKCVSMVSLPDADSSKLSRRIRSHHQNSPHPSQNSITSSSSSSHRIKHSISTPNLVLTALSSSIAVAASADNMTVERCLLCGLPDLSTVTATTTVVGARRENDPNTVAAGMASSSLSDSAGLQGGRPTMRRLKQQRRRRAIFPKKQSSKFLNLVNFGSLSDLLTRSCHCDKSTDPASISRNRRTVHSASLDFSTLISITPSTPVTDFGRTRRELSATVNPSILPSLSEDFRDPELERSSKNLVHSSLRDSREHLRRSEARKGSRETMEEFLVAMETEGEGEEVEEVGVDAVIDTIDGQSGNMSSWMMRNPEKGVAIVQNKVSKQDILEWILLHPEDGIELIRLLKESQNFPEADLDYGIRLRHYDGRPRRIWSFSRSSSDQTGVSPLELIVLTQLDRNLSNPEFNQSGSISSINRKCLFHRPNLRLSIQNPFFDLTKCRLPILTRRSLSQTFLASNEESEKSLAFKHQMVDVKWSASSTECLAKVSSTSTMSSSSNNIGSDRLVNTFAPGTMTFVMLKEHLKQNVLQGPTFKGHIYSDFSQLPVPFPYFSNPKVKSSAVHLVICVHGLEVIRDPIHPPILYYYHP
ncbi:hypothetical protein ACTXT7_006342 [Hymenolepis weldensis]